MSVRNGTPSVAVRGLVSFGATRAMIGLAGLQEMFVRYRAILGPIGAATGWRSSPPQRSFSDSGEAARPTPQHGADHACERIESSNGSNRGVSTVAYAAEARRPRG